MPVESDRRRNIVVGLISLLVLAALFALGVRLQVGHRETERQHVYAADAAMVRGIGGDCRAFGQAQALYTKAMQHYLQNKDLAGKTEIAGELAAWCGRLSAEEIRRRELAAVASRYARDEVRALALAQLATGNRDGALFTLSRLPDDALCRWLSGWLRSLPPR